MNEGMGGKESRSCSAIVAMVADVEGFLDEPEIPLLYCTARDSLPPNATVVEIGSFKGKSTVLLARGLKDGQGGRVYAIDPHVGSEEHKQDGKDIWTYDVFLRNIRSAGVDDMVTPVVEYSHKAASALNLTGIDFLWIDGAHDYQSVLQDYELWEPRLAVGGIIAFHDTFGDGPHRVVRRHVFRSGKFCRIRFVRSVVCACKTDRRSMLESARSFRSYLLWECYSALAASAFLRRVFNFCRWQKGE